MNFLTKFTTLEFVPVDTFKDTFLPKLRVVKGVTWIGHKIISVT